MDRQCCATRMRQTLGQAAGRIAPGPGIGQDRLNNGVWGEVVIVFDHDSLVRICDGLSVDNNFDHFRVSSAGLLVRDWVMKVKIKRRFVSSGGVPPSFYMCSADPPEAPH